MAEHLRLLLDESDTDPEVAIALGIVEVQPL